MIGKTNDRYLLISYTTHSDRCSWADALAYCNAVYNGFSALEKAAVMSVSTYDCPIVVGINNYAAAELNGAKLFLLSASETDTYLPYGNDDRAPQFNWWTRSHTSDKSLIVNIGDNPRFLSINVNNTNYASARPAFVLDRSAVLFESEKDGNYMGKPAANSGFGVFRDPGTAQRKLTLLDSSRSGFAASAGSSTVAPGGTLAVTYSGAKTGTNEYVSAMITDRCCDGGTIINYKLPRTGDDANLTLWFGCVLGGLTALALTVSAGKRKKANSK